MKTGWVMEWENEVRYAAPIRAELNRLAEMFAPISRALVNLGDAVGRSVMAMRGLNKVLPPTKFTQLEGE